jgi:hypothetical protein
MFWPLPTADLRPSLALIKSQSQNPRSVAKTHRFLVPVVIMVVIVVTVVTPLPVLLLLVLIQTAEIAVVAMSFDDPLVVVNPLTTVPAMSVVVVRVLIVMGAADSDCGHEKCGSQ